MLNDLSFVYTGYFASLCKQGRIADAFRTIERARGRIEAQELAHHAVVAPHSPTQAEQRLTKLTLTLVDAGGAEFRGQVLRAIDATEEQIDDASPTNAAPSKPVSLHGLQGDLRPSELLIEYVLSSPHSYALAISHRSVHLYQLSPEETLNREAMEYRKQLVRQQADPVLAQQLFDALLGGVPEYRTYHNVIIVPDGKLDLLPFSALMNSGHYVLTDHSITVAPSGAVFDRLRHRSMGINHDAFSFLGIAAWTSKPPSTSWLASIHRAVFSSSHKKLPALPDSRYEVETAGSDLPQPRTILLGAQATVDNFERLPLSQYDVIHLALHGYVDPEFPDQSALVFAPGNAQAAGGFLRVPDIRRLHLDAGLVTLSACNTGVGPVSVDGVNDIVNAFIEAGAQSVVSTLWAVEDQATAHFMTIFYRNLGKGDSKAESLRRAQLVMMKNGVPPYFWAGFELDGEPSDPVVYDKHIDDLVRQTAHYGVSQ